MVSFHLHVLKLEWMGFLVKMKALSCCGETTWRSWAAARWGWWKTITAGRIHFSFELWKNPSGLDSLLYSALLYRSVCLWMKVSAKCHPCKSNVNLCISVSLYFCSLFERAVFREPVLSWTNWTCRWLKFFLSILRKMWTIPDSFLIEETLEWPHVPHIEARPQGFHQEHDYLYNPHSGFIPVKNNK